MMHKFNYKCIDINNMYKKTDDKTSFAICQ